MRADCLSGLLLFLWKLNKKGLIIHRTNRVCNVYLVCFFFRAVLYGLPLFVPVNMIVKCRFIGGKLVYTNQYKEVSMCRNQITRDC